MKKTERQVLWYDIRIKATSKTIEAPKPIEIKKAFKIIEKLENRERYVDSSDKQEHYYISDWKSKNETALIILINKSDKSVADPIFFDVSSRERREVTKTLTEGQDYSSHILIKFDDKNKFEATMLLEYCPGFGGATMIKYTLNQLMKKAKSHSPSEFTKNHPDGSLEENGEIRKYSVNYSFILDGHPSDSFIQDLEEGELKGLDLITKENISPGFDEDSYLQEDRVTLLVKPKKDASRKKKLYDIIKDYLRKRQDKYEYAKIRFTGPDGIHRTVNLQREDDKSSIYIKKSIIDEFSEDLKSSYEKVQQEIADKMEKLLENQYDRENT